MELRKIKCKQIGEKILPWFLLYFGNKRANKSAAQLATWINGPSFPTFKPEETEKTKPIHFTRRVLGLLKSWITKPPRIVLISAIPLPAAQGEKVLTKTAAIVANST